MLVGITLIQIFAIIFRDIRSHKILNRDNGILCILLLFQRQQESLVVTIVAIALSLPIFLLLKIGMGDYKLWSVLLISEGSLILTERYLLFMTIAVVATYLSACLRGSNRGASIAFAPVLLAPFAAIYLDI